MDIKELTALFVTACETNRCRYIPWWEYNPGSYNYKYNVFTDSEIKDIEEFVNENGGSIAVKPVGSTGLKFFHAFVWLGFYNIVEKLLDNKTAGIDINMAGSGNKITPVMLACSRGNLKMAELFIKHGADISLCDINGRNVYYYLVCPYIKGLVPSYEGQKKSLGQRKEIVRLLAEDTNNGYINKKDTDGFCPLVCLLKSSNTNISWCLTNILLENGADTSYIDENGNTLLMLAIYNHHMTAALSLIKAGTGINHQNNEGITPLKLAINYHNEALCMALKEHGAEGECTILNMDLSNLARITSNAFASYSEDEMDNKSIALYLAEKLVKETDIDDDDDLNCLLGIFYNALSGNKECEVLDICHDGGIDFTMPVYSSGSVTCIRDECIKKYNLGVIKKFISFGLDINKPLVKGITPAYIVASLKERNMFSGMEDDYFEKAVKFFSKESMEYTNDMGTTAMHQAARNNHYKMLEIMAEKGADVNITEDSPAEAGNTPLHTACIYGSTEAVKILKKYGADDSIQNVNGETPAHLAVMKKKFGGDLKTGQREALLKELKNIDIARNDGKTPLMLLQYMDINTNITLLPLFTGRNIDINHTDNYGNTALILNARNNCYKAVIKELVRAGADINAVDCTGNNALHYSLEYGNQEAAYFLLKKGADCNRANNKGITPAQIIVEKGYDTLLGLIDII